MRIVRSIPYSIQDGQYVDAAEVTKNLIQIVEDVNANALAAGGDPTKPFAVANATASNQAVNLGQANSLYAPIAGNAAQAFAVANAVSADQAVNLKQLGNYNQVIPNFATGTLPSTCWGGAVQVASNATITLPADNPPAGSKVVLYGNNGAFSVVSNSNQFIWAPPLGLTSTTGQTTVNVPECGWIEITSRGDGEYNVTGGSPLVFQNTAPVFTRPVNAQAFNPTASASLAGTTAGSVAWAQYLQGAFKAFAAQALGYQNNTATAQTITFPTPFTNTPEITTNTTGLSLSVSTTELTINAPNNTTAYSGIIEVKGF